ncbi:hypothetical protein ACIP95_10565 [Micromonospora parva]
MVDEADLPSLWLDRQWRLPEAVGRTDACTATTTTAYASSTMVPTRATPR